MIQRLPFLPFLLVLAALGAGGCEVSYKAQDDAMYYTDRGLAQVKKIEQFARSRFDKNYHPEIDDLPLHLSNFDTFICDGARQIVANFDREELSVATKFDGRNKYLTRTVKTYPFSDGIYDLFVMEDGSLLVQKDSATIYQHCRPLVADAMKSKPYQGGDLTYEYTPTISPADYNAYDNRFHKAMSK